MSSVVDSTVAKEVKEEIANGVILDKSMIEFCEKHFRHVFTEPQIKKQKRSYSKIKKTSQTQAIKKVNNENQSEPKNADDHPYSMRVQQGDSGIKATINPKSIFTKYMESSMETNFPLSDIGNGKQ